MHGALWTKPPYLSTSASLPLCGPTEPRQSPPPRKVTAPAQRRPTPLRDLRAIRGSKACLALKRRTKSVRAPLRHPEATTPERVTSRTFALPQTRVIPGTPRGHSTSRIHRARLAGSSGYDEPCSGTSRGIDYGKGFDFFFSDHRRTCQNVKAPARIQSTPSGTNELRNTPFCMPSIPEPSCSE